MGTLEPEVQALVDQVVALGPRATAAFDADGTIWSGDLGEEFLADLAQRRLLLDPPPGDTYARYEQLFATDPPRAFAFCVEVMKGLRVDEVERWSDAFFRDRFAARVFPGVRQALDRLRAAGVEVFLVSASNAITIRRAAAALGVDPSMVLAIEGAVDGQGRLTGQVLPPLTCGQGKVEAIQAKAKNSLALAFGNSVFDREMLAHAQRAVMVAPNGSEGPAVGLARSQGWSIHRVDAPIR